MRSEVHFIFTVNDIEKHTFYIDFCWHNKDSQLKMKRKDLVRIKRAQHFVRAMTATIPSWPHILPRYLNKQKNNDLNQICSPSSSLLPCYTVPWKKKLQNRTLISTQLVNGVVFHAQSTWRLHHRRNCIMSIITTLAALSHTYFVPINEFSFQFFKTLVSSTVCTLPTLAMRANKKPVIIYCQSM